jgi:hypothetical protein
VVSSFRLVEPIKVIPINVINMPFFGETAQL